MNQQQLDPVCGMAVTPEQAAASLTYKGQTYYFCALACKQRFEPDPELYLNAGPPIHQQPSPMVQLRGLSMKPAPPLPVVGLSSRKTTAESAVVPALPGATVPPGGFFEEPASVADRIELPITGMTCAACANHIEKALAGTPGIRQAIVNFATRRATVVYQPGKADAGAIRRVVEGLGYGVATVPGGEADEADAEERASEGEYRGLLRKFWVAAVLSLPVLTIAMSHGKIAALNFTGVEWLELALTTPVVFYSGRQFYRGAWSALLHRFADMNTLIAVGTGAA